MKGNPDRPECGFSKGKKRNKKRTQKFLATCAVLNHYGYKYSSFNVNINPYYKEALKKYSLVFLFFSFLKIFKKKLANNASSLYQWRICRRM